MNDAGATYGGKRRTPKPLDPVRLEELALAYVARFATSSGKLRAYLQRKLRERGHEGEAPDVDGIVARFVENGYVDDEAYGRAKSSDLTGRGYGPRRVEQALRSAGIGEELRAQLDPAEHASRRAALVLARKRGFGPFAKLTEGDPEETRKRREKQLAAMIRAGHGFDTARHAVDASSVEELEEWVEECRSETE